MSLKTAPAPSQSRVCKAVGSVRGSGGWMASPFVSERHPAIRIVTPRAIPRHGVHTGPCSRHFANARWGHVAAVRDAPRDGHRFHPEVRV
jgi:hypothetical protein